MDGNDKKLGMLEKVELRQIWKNEAGNFTPWLAEEENISLLGGAIGIELELEETEKTVGVFSADILARNTESNEYVLIENQLKRADHLTTFDRVFRPLVKQFDPSDWRTEEPEYETE